MRIVKKVLFERITELPQFKKIRTTFGRLKLKESKSTFGISSVKEISRLQFYFVIEYINVIQEKIDYNKIFPDSENGEATCIDYNILSQEQDRIKKLIAYLQSEYPECFKKLGISKEVVGCFIIATNKKTNSIRKLNLYKKEHCIAVRLNYSDLPKEFELMCADFAKSKREEIDREQEEFDRFMTLSQGEQDNIISDFLHNIQYPSLYFPESNESEEIDNFIFDSVRLNQVPSGTTIESAAEASIDQTTDIKYLSAMLDSALEREKYELCAKIRDRLIILKNL